MELFFPDYPGTSDYYLCSTNDHVTPLDNWDHISDDSSLNIDHDQITLAEAGKFIIIFRVSDLAGNTECDAPQRTVIVRDTLPPVITLHLKHQLIHTSDSSQSGIGGVDNPAGQEGEGNNPNLGDGNSPNGT